MNPGRSRLVTVLGWYLLVSNLVMVPMFAGGVSTSVQILSQPGAREAAIASVGGPSAHPYVRWQAEHTDVHMLLRLCEGVAYLALGYGLVRRHAWGLKWGAVLLALAVAQALLGLVSIQVWGLPTLPSVPRSVTASMASMQVGATCVGLAFYGLVFWKFSQPSVQDEFVEGPGRRTMR